MEQKFFICPKAFEQFSTPSTYTYSFYYTFSTFDILSQLNIYFLNFENPFSHL